MNDLNQIETHFNNNSFFPEGSFLWEKGKAVYEFPFIQKVSDEEYIVHSQRHHATNPFLMVENSSWTFKNLDEAFIKLQKLENGDFL